MSKVKPFSLQFSLFFYSTWACWHINCGSCTLTLSSLLGLLGPLGSHCWLSHHRSLGAFSAAGRARSKRSTRSTALMNLMHLRLASENSAGVDAFTLLKCCFSFSEIYHHKHIASKYSRGIQKACSSLTFLKQAAAETGKFWFKANAD